MLRLVCYNLLQVRDECIRILNYYSYTCNVGAARRKRNGTRERDLAKIRPPHQNLYA
jgi:hypothetical protein